MTKEASVISAVCKNKDVHLILGEDAALFGAYGDAFSFVKEHYLKYKAVPDPKILEQRFGDLELPETTAPTNFYLEELRDSFVQSRIQEVMVKAATAIKDGQSSPAILEKMTTALAKLGKYTHNVRDLNITDMDAAEEHFRKLKEIADANGGTPGIATGFKSIDASYSTGLAGGQSIVIMGYTGRAKSMWAGLLAVQAWRQGYKPMIISLEMSPEEQMERIYAMMASGVFRISDMSRGNVNLDDFREWGRRSLVDKNDFVIVSSQGVTEVTPNVIQAKIDTHKPDIVILDYMQLMSDNAKTGPMTPRMMNLSREIKMMATSNAIPIVSITAVTDEDGDKRDAPPVLAQISWSSAIEYDANLVVAVHRHDDSNIVECVARKSRHGELFGFFFEVDFDRGIWEEKHELNAPEH